ncbi:helix-turn-helix transcriptional regulator [Streptomyces sp. NPDC019890]|uniref:helix-turn-helix domain-containing protein n=1 Tax=Streptomyces sp. NPDC019890 TaxID=3365064 RepID=UPI00384C0238
MTPLRLTPAQLRVLSKIALGKNTDQTASELLITSGTVSVQLTSISRKLGVSGRAALVPPPTSLSRFLGLSGIPSTASSPTSSFRHGGSSPPGHPFSRWPTWAGSLGVPLVSRSRSFGDEWTLPTTPTW